MRSLSYAHHQLGLPPKEKCYQNHEQKIVTLNKSGSHQDHYELATDITYYIVLLLLFFLCHLRIVISVTSQ